VSCCCVRRPESVSVQVPARLGEQGNRVAADMGGEGVAEVGKERALLQTAGDRRREQPLDAALALFGLAAERELAVDDRPAQAPFGMVVGRLDAVDLGEGPQRRPELEQVLGESAVAAVAGTLARRSFEQRPELRLERSDALDQAGAVAIAGKLLPRAEQLLGDPQAGQTELLLGSEPWGTDTRSCRALVLVDQSTEKVSPLDVWHAVDLFDRRSTFESPELQSAMRPPLVVGRQVDLQNPIQMPGTEDQQPVQALCAQRLHPAL
jgi:hypothetical protein